MRGRLLALALVLSGCSFVNDPASHQGGAAPIEPVDACRRLAELQCDGYFDCCSTAADRTDQLYMQCVEQARVKCTNDFGKLVVDDRTGYDPVVAGAVIAEGRGYVDRCDPDIVEWFTNRTGLQHVLTGTVEGGHSCTPRDTNLTSFDQAALLSCLGPDQACVASSLNDWVCRQRAPEGERCILYWDCVDGLRCDWSRLSGTCAQRVPDGGACASGPDCTSLVCASNLCVPRTQDSVYCGAM